MKETLLNIQDVLTHPCTMRCSPMMGTGLSGAAITERTIRQLTGNVCLSRGRSACLPQNFFFKELGVNF